MKKRILFSIMVIALAATLVAGATTAYFSDVERSFGNTFTAGSLDLKIDGKDCNVVKFVHFNMKPGDVVKGFYKLSNDGTIPGYLNISKIDVKDFENCIIEPEQEAGDNTPDIGELSSFLEIHLFIDLDRNGRYSGPDEEIYNGLLKDMPESIFMNRTLLPGDWFDIIGEAIVKWEPTDQDNLAQTDSCTLDLEFTLNQVEQSAAN